MKPYLQKNEKDVDAERISDKNLKALYEKRESLPYGGVYFEPIESKPKGGAPKKYRVVLKNSKGTFVGYDGDFIVKDQVGEISIWNKEAFESTFSLVKDAK